MSGSRTRRRQHRFEAGRPRRAQARLATGRSSASSGCLSRAHDGDHRYALDGLLRLPPRILGPTSLPTGRLGVVLLACLRDRIPPHDPRFWLPGIAVRGGHHCARPLHERFGIQSSTRASFYLYTTRAEIDALVDGLDYTMKFFGGAR